MRLSTKIAYNTFVQIVSKVIATILGLVSVAIITRYLGKSGFGEYTTIMTFLSFFGIMADLGLTLVTVQMISQPGVKEEKVLNNLFSLRLISAVLFLGAAPLVVLFFPYSPLVKLGVAITTFSFLFIALNQVLVGLFQKKLRMDKVSIAEVAGRLFLVAGVGMAAYLDKGLLGIMVATVAANAINFLLHFSFSRKFAKIKLRFDFYLWKQIIKKSWPLALTIVLNLIYLKSDILVLSLVKPQAHVGIYGAAYKVIDVLIIIPFMFAGIILPVLTSSWASNKFAYFKKVLQKSFDFMMILAIPLVVGAQFLADQIVRIIASNEFEASANVLRILILAAGLIFFACMFSHAIIALDKQKKVIGAYIFTSITSLIGYIVFIPKFSYMGAAWLTVYSEVVIAVFSVYYVWKYSGFLPSMRNSVKALGASVLMAGFLVLLPSYFYSNWLGLVLILLSSGVVYFVSLYAFKGITSKDLLDVLNK